MPGPIDYGSLVQGLLGSMVQPVADPIWQKKQGILGGLGTEGARSRPSGGVPRPARSREEAWDAGFEAFHSKIPRKKAPGEWTDHWKSGWDSAKHEMTGRPPKD